MKILIIAPHPDDEVLGCGGTIAKYSKKGADIYLCIVTKAYVPDWSEKFIENRVKEIKKSNKILGIKKTYFLNFPSAKIDTIPQKKLYEAIFSVIKKAQPDVLYIPHGGDINKDHRIIFESALAASKPFSHKIKKILSYETLSETEWGQAIKPFIPNLYINISETFSKKLKAMKAYGSELKDSPHPRSLEIIEILAKKRGSEVALKYAEAFMLIREII